MILRDVAEVAAYQIASLLARGLPLRSARRLAGAVADRVLAAHGKTARLALANLRIAFPELAAEQLQALARESFLQFTWNLIDFLRAERWGEAEIRRRVAFEGIELLMPLLSEKRGAFVLTLHLGNFELANLAAPLYGIPLTVVARPMANERIYARVLRQRQRTGAEVIGRRRVAPAVLRAVRRGRVVAVLNDQYSRRARGVFVPLFGQRCSTSAGLATLALRSGAPVLPFYIVRDGEDHHTARFAPPLEVRRSGDRRRDILELTERFNAALEAIIRCHPTQWMWSHRRFRHSPDLGFDPYAARPAGAELGLRVPPGEPPNLPV